MLPWLIAGVLGFLLFTDTKKEPLPTNDETLPPLPKIPPVFVPPIALPPGIPTGPPPPPPPGTTPMQPPGGLPGWPATAPPWWPAGVPYPPVLGPADEPAGWPPGVPFPPLFPLPPGVAFPPQPPPGGPVPFAQVVPCDYYIVHDSVTWSKVASAPNLGDPFVRNAYEATLKTWFDNVCGIPASAQIGFSMGNWYLLRQCGADLVLLDQCFVTP